MTISKDLFLSILAMDAYNRGYGAGIADGENRDGEGPDTDGLGMTAGTTVGAATVQSLGDLNISPETYQAWQAASFYAIAYKVGPDGPAGLVGKTVISCRGTDDPNPFSLTYPFVDLNIDPVTGWRVGASRTGSPVPRCGYGR